MCFHLEWSNFETGSRLYGLIVSAYLSVPVESYPSSSSACGLSGCCTLLHCWIGHGSHPDFWRKTSGGYAHLRTDVDRYGLSRHLRRQCEWSIWSDTFELIHKAPVIHLTSPPPPVQEYNLIITEVTVVREGRSDMGFKSQEGKPSKIEVTASVYVYLEEFTSKLSPLIWSLVVSERHHLARWFHPTIPLPEYKSVDQARNQSVPSWCVTTFCSFGM